MLKKSLFFLLAVLLSTAALAQNAQNSNNLEIYGYGAMTIKGVGNQSFYDLTKARLGIISQPANFVTIKGEYDIVTNSPKYAFGKISRKNYGLNWSVTFGQYLNPVAWAYPGPAYLETYRYPITWTGHTSYLRGLCLQAGNGDLEVMAANANETDFAGLISWRQQIFLVYEDGIGWGGAYKNNFSKCLNPFLGFSQRSEGYRLFIQNHIKLNKRVKLFAQLDYDEAVSKSYLSAGSCYEIMPNSFVKIFYDEYYKSARGEITFFFKK